MSSIITLPSTCVQDTALTNVDAVNLFWTSGGATVVAEGMTFSNVTTESDRWDEAGSPVGIGDGANVVQPYGQPAERPSASGSLPALAVTPLSNVDSWIESLRQVLSLLAMCSLVGLKCPSCCVMAGPAIGRDACMHACSLGSFDDNQVRTLMGTTATAGLLVLPSTTV